MLILSEKQQGFIEQYIKKRKKIQKIWPISIGIIIIIIIIINQAQYHNDTTQTTNSIQTQIIKSAIDKYLSWSTYDDTIVEIIQWPRERDLNSIKSNNNLLLRWGWVLPRNSAILNTDIIKKKEYFSWSDYDIDTLRIQINNLVNPWTNQIVNRHNNNVIQKKTITEQFNIQCLEKYIHAPLCNKNINIFLDNFYTFDLQNHNKELVQISKKIKKKNHIIRYCEKIWKHIQYNQLFEKQRWEAIQICDEKIRKDFIRSQEFFTINNEFINNNFSSIVYDDKNLNAYKLLSLAQTTIQDLENNIINTRRIQAYIQQMQAILRKPILDDIYRDIHYRIINYYIIPWIDEQQNKTANINQIRTQLLGLNRENTLLQYSGLQTMITNKWLIEKIQKDTIQSKIPNPENIIQSLNALPYIQINTNTIQEDKIFIVGELQTIDTMNNSARTKFFATWAIQLNRLIIDNINLPEHPLFTTILNTFIQSRNTTLPWLYNYINENIALYQNQIQQDICKELEEITLFIKNICNVWLIQWKLQRNNTTIDIKITIENNTIQSIQTSDNTYTQYLQNNYVGKISDSIRIGGIIKEIIMAQPTASENTITTNENIIQVANMFQSFFKRQAIDIAYIQDTYYIEFIVDSIIFVIAYNLQKNKLWPLFFKDILINNRPLRTNKRIFDPITENIQTINKFINNPINFIQEIDPFTYEIYMQFK